MRKHQTNNDSALVLLDHLFNISIVGYWLVPILCLHRANQTSYIKRITMMENVLKLAASAPFDNHIFHHLILDYIVSIKV